MGMQQRNEIQSELEAIDRLSFQVSGGAASAAPQHMTDTFLHSPLGTVSAAGAAISTPSGMLGVIQMYPQLAAAIERVSSRPLPLPDLQQDVLDPTDFPRELKKRLDALAKVKKYEKALEVKDRMLWEVIQGHK